MVLLLSSLHAFEIVRRLIDDVIHVAAKVITTQWHNNTIMVRGVNLRVVIPKSSTDGGTDEQRIEGIPSRNFYFISTTLYFSGMCFHLVFLYIIGYNEFSWRPHNPTPPTHPPKIWEVATPESSELTSIWYCPLCKVRKCPRDHTIEHGWRWIIIVSIGHAQGHIRRLSGSLRCKCTQRKR